MDRSGGFGEEGFMKAVVTGGAGFLGSNLAEDLIAGYFYLNLVGVLK